MFSVRDDEDGPRPTSACSVTVDEVLAPEIAHAVSQDEIYLAKTAAG